MNRKLCAMGVGRRYISAAFWNVGRIARRAPKNVIFVELRSIIRDSHRFRFCMGM